MRKGQIFEFRSKMFGLQYPDNIAVCLGTSKKGKKHLIVAFTLRGKQHIRPEHVTKKKIDYPDMKEELYDSTRLIEKLRNIVREIRGGKERKRTGRERKKHNVKASKIVAKDTTAKDIWLSLNEEEFLTVEEITARFLHTRGPTSGQIEKVREKVMGSIEEGLPYFRIGGKNRKIIHLLSQDEYRMIIDRIRSLRKLFEMMEKFKEERTKEIFPSSSPHDLAPVELLKVFHGFLITRIPDAKPVIRQIGSADLEKSLLNLCREMEEFVKYDEWGKNMGIGIERITMLDDFDLKKFTRKVASSVTCLKKSSLTTMFTTFLIITGYWTIEKAVGMYVKRFINTGVFDFKLGYPKIFDEKIMLAKAESMSRGSLTGIGKNRKDMRELFTVTVDPVDAKDFDDAISIIEKGNETVLYVHIADVSHYVTKDSTLDDEAFYRCTSVYLPDMVLPMLPEILSNDLCSLRSGVDRFAISTKMIFDENLKLRDFEIFPSIIRVDQNLSYGEVLEYYQKNEEPYLTWIEFSKSLRDLRDQLELRTSELKIHLEGNRLDRTLKTEDPATRMIECFMVATNEVAAMYLTAFTESVVYRVHGLPDSIGFEKYNEIIERLELNIKTFDEEDIGHEERRIAEDWYGRSDESGLSFGNIVIRYENGIDENLKRSIGILDDNRDDEKKKYPGRRENLKSVSFGENGFHAEFRKKLRGELLGEYSHTKLVEAREILREELNKKVVLERRDYFLKCLNEVLNSVNEGVNDTDLRELLNIIILKTLQLAVYSTDNISHFGLGSNYYLHFTSPIRRYADLIVHRILKSIFAYTDRGKNDIAIDERDRRDRDRKDMDSKDRDKRDRDSRDMDSRDRDDKDSKEFDPDYTKDNIDEICERCSEQSRNADKFERKINDICVCLEKIFDEKFWREKQNGIITETIPRGMFVSLKEGIEGFIPRKRILKYRIKRNGNYDGKGENDLHFEKRSGSKKNGKSKHGKNKHRKSTHGKRDHRKLHKNSMGKDGVILGIGDRVLIAPKRFQIEKGRIEMKIIKNL